VFLIEFEFIFVVSVRVIVEAS